MEQARFQKDAFQPQENMAEWTCFVREYRSPVPCTDFIRISLRQSLPLYTQCRPNILKKDKQLSNLYWYH